MTDQVTKEDFWSHMKDARAGFLGLEHGAARPVPMSHYVDEDEGVLWFITAQGTELADALAAGSSSARYVVSSADARIYACIDGNAQVVSDDEKLDEMWNAIAAAWFEDGKRDSDIRLVKFQPNTAEVWTTPGKLGFLYEIAKANISDDTADMGAHGHLAFAA